MINMLTAWQKMAQYLKLKLVYVFKFSDPSLSNIWMKILFSQWEDEKKFEF